ncbi:MAG: mechanosensitive ion channel family protein [Planctomycetota bacterium]
MKKTLACIMLPMAVLLMSGYVVAQEQSQGDQTSGAEGELTVGVPDLADIIPLASELSGRLATLENTIGSGLDTSAVEKKYDTIEANLKDPAGQLQRLRDSKDYKHNKLVKLRKTIKKEEELLEEISKPLSDAIRQLGTRRTEWLTEKKLWSEWQSSLQKEGELDQLKSTFENANRTIDAALALILPRLEAMLTVQQKGGNIQERIYALAAELDALTAEELRDVLLDVSPPMFSSQYLSQFTSGLWYAVKRGMDEISWPDSRFFARQGWIVLLQGFVSLFVIIAVYRNRRVLNESKRWRFLAARPFSAGLFLTSMTTALFYEYGGAPAIWILANVTVAGISFARLSGGLIEASWKRQFVYGLVTVFIVTRLVEVLSFPLPLLRLYTVLAALVGLLLCLRWARESSRHKESPLYRQSLRLGCLLFAIIMIAELWGKHPLPLYLLASLIRSIATALVFMLFMYMIHGGLEWLFRSSPLRRAAALYSDDTDAVIRRVTRLIDVAMLGLVLLPAILMIWGVYDSLEGATKGLLALGFNLGSRRISVGLLIVSAGILYASFLASWILRRLLIDVVLARREADRGVRHSIARLVHYVIIFLAFLFALSTLGFDVTKLTIILSALGVGIGFGLQGVVNNFVSGLILLFERPVRVGDTIQIGQKWAEIKKIGIRATTVQTFDHADLIIPNADLIANQVTNWTLSNRQVRLIIPVGVAYGSNVSLVMETLMACANANSMVAKRPTPRVLFLSFGESSLDFELRVWVTDSDYRLRVQSELHQDIDRRFREAKIEIAFPQRDLHLRSFND